MKIESWQLLAEEEVSPAKWFRVFRRKYRMPGGKLIDDFYVSKLGDVAMVVARTQNNQIVMVQQFKPGFGEVMLELPAGRFKDGASPEETARAELKEETGLEVNKLVLLGKLSEMPTKDPMTVYIFYTDEIRGWGERCLDETEEIEVVKVPIDELESKIKNGEIKGASTIASLSLAKMKGYLK